MLAFWLMPAGEAKQFFVSLVRELAGRFHAPLFEPHVTLQATEAQADKATSRRLREICASGMPIDLEIERIDFSPQYTKTLFVRFHPSAPASALSKALSSGSAGYEFNPHLSLLYKELPEDVKRETAAGIRVPFPRAQFDAVKVISTPAAIATAAGVEAWQTVAECQLGPVARAWHGHPAR